MTTTKDFAEVIRQELAADPKLRAEVEKELANIAIRKKRAAQRKLKKKSKKDSK